MSSKYFIFFLYFTLQRENANFHLRLNELNKISKLPIDDYFQPSWHGPDCHPVVVIMGDRTVQTVLLL